MNEELKKEAEALIDKWHKLLNPDAPDCNLSHRQLKQCAILECQSIIKELEFINYEYVAGYPYKMVQDRITHYQSLIKQIEIQ